MKADALDSDVERVAEKINNLGFQPHKIVGVNRTAVCITGNQEAVDPADFSNLPGVSEAISITKPYKLSSNKNQPQRTAVKVGETEIGGDNLTIIGGVCAVESREQVFAVAESVKRSGAKLFRGGAFKPRTSPYAFQGLGEEGLQILSEVRREFDLKIVTEAIDEKSVEMVENYADMIQIGTRNMQNFALLKRVGKSNLPVLLKRGMSATLEEFLLSAEYILSEGNEQVVLCERGIRTFANHARNTLDLSIIPAVKKVSHLPIIVDPSHGTGKSYMVGALARAGVAVGADGILIEIHPSPEDALSDGAQAILPEEYLELVGQLKAVYEVISAVGVS